MATTHAGGTPAPDVNAGCVYHFGRGIASCPMVSHPTTPPRQYASRWSVWGAYTGLPCHQGIISPGQARPRRWRQRLSPPARPRPPAARKKRGHQGPEGDPVLSGGERSQVRLTLLHRVRYLLLLKYSAVQPRSSKSCPRLGLRESAPQATTVRSAVAPRKLRKSNVVLTECPESRTETIRPRARPAPSPRGKPTWQRHVQVSAALLPDTKLRVDAVEHALVKRRN